MGRVIDFREAKKRIIKKKKSQDRKFNNDYKILLLVSIALLFIIAISLIFRKEDSLYNNNLFHTITGMGIF
jgi:hypothetical protein